MGVSKSKELSKKDSVLYGEVLNRPGVRDYLTRYGFRRAILRHEKMTKQDWINLLKQFDGADHFRNSYTAAYTTTSKLGIWESLKKEMGKLNLWTSIVGHDGRIYDSRSEAIVANWLLHSHINYEIHPPLPFNTQTNYLADLRLTDKDLWVEVYMCSQNGFHARNNSPEWAPDYLENREQKEALYTEHLKGKRITIEAEIYRAKGLNKYLEHIKSQFAKCGIELSPHKGKGLDINGTARGTDWTEEQFIEYADSNNLTQLDGFNKPGHSDLYKVLEMRDMRDDIKRALDEKHGRTHVARGKYLISAEKLRKLCKKLVLKSRSDYLAARRNNLLPNTAPSSVRQAYGLTFTEFITGRKRDDFCSLTEAMLIVHKKGFKNRGEFLKAVRIDPEMARIRKSPSSPQGGYKGWPGWSAFLGKSKITARLCAR